MNVFCFAKQMHTKTFSALFKNHLHMMYYIFDGYLNKMPPAKTSILIEKQRTKNKSYGRRGDGK